MAFADQRDDQDLIEACNAGDSAAFEVLYRRYCDWVVALAYRFTANRDGALDVMQDAFVYLLGKFPGFVLTCQLKTFLYPVVRNLALQQRRRSGRAVSADELLDSLPAPDVSSTQDDDLVAVLSILPVGQREVLVMRFVDGLSLGEIAQALAIPVGTVKSRLHNALKTMRQDGRTNKFLER